MTVTLLFLASGLYLGWLLGTNDTINIFGSAVSLKMISYRTAAFIVSLFILLGAIFQGKGTTASIHKLGNISEPTIAFIIVLCAALIVLFLIKYNLPVSTSQSIVGAMVGWNIYTFSYVDWHLLSQFVISWILAPALGIIIGIAFFKLIRWFIKRSRIHLIKLDSYLQIVLVFFTILAAYGLGANNIGNVIGVFTNLSPNLNIDFGIITIDRLQILYFLGGISIAVGIYSVNWRSLNEAGKGVLSLAPEATIVVVATQAFVLFLFSSTWFANHLSSMGLPSFPLIPVSSTQIAVGAVIGIGVVKGAREIEGKSLARIGIGWIIAPLAAAILTYSLLFIIDKLFGLPLHHEIISSQITHPDTTILADKTPVINLVLPGIIALTAILIIVLVYLFFRQQKLRLKIEKDMLIQQNQLYAAQKTMNELEMRTIAVENDGLNIKLQAKRKEFMDIALNINEQRTFFEKISTSITEIIADTDNNVRNDKLNNLSLLIKQKMSFPQEKKEFYLQIEEIHKDFQMKLMNNFPDLTNLEKRLAGLLRLNLSTKEISTLLNISPKSVEVARYRLKKKMNIEKDKSLNNFITNL